MAKLSESGNSTPLTGPRSLSSEAPTKKDAWIRAFLEELASEALDYHQLLMDLEWEWFRALPPRRRGRASSERWLFALRGLTPMSDETLPPRRPEPGRRRGRPRKDEAEAKVSKQISSTAPLSPLQQGVFDYSVLRNPWRILKTWFRRTR